MTDQRLPRRRVVALAGKLAGTTDKLWDLRQAGKIPESVDGGLLTEDLADIGALEQCESCLLWLDVAEVVDGWCEDCIAERDGL